MAKGVDAALIGRTIAGKFTIESYIGAGAMGAVYKARQTALDKIVALKVLHRELATDEAFTARFKREAKAASRLDHPNSVRVIDFGVEPDGLMYIAMELLDGRDLLRVLVEDWPLSGPRVAGILMQALAALGVAHELGVVHRDLKPENIMILPGTNDDGQKTDVVKVCDFGIAKLEVRSEKISQAGGPLTGQGLVVGTPEYMSPEQGRGEKLDARTDLYSMGVILFQLLTGRVPFEAESALGLVFKHVTEEPPRPSAINPTADPRLEAICLKAMRKDREERFQTAREMRAELRSVLGGSVSVVLPPSSPFLPASSPFTADDTAPMPLVSREPTSGAEAVSAPERPDFQPKTTSGAAAFLDHPERQSRAPSPALLAFALTALGAVLVAAFAVHRTSQHDLEADPASSAPAHGPMSPPDPAPSGSVATAGTASAESAASESSQAPPSSAASATTRGPRTTTTGHHAKSEPQKASAAVPPTGPSSTNNSFDLTTASANPSVVGAVGATARDVRAALPGAVFTQCYRDALKRTGRRVEGRMAVHVQMGPDGRITSALVTAPESLAQGMGNCITQSFNELPVANVAPSGGSADISIVFVPQ